MSDGESMMIRVMIKLTKVVMVEMHKLKMKTSDDTIVHIQLHVQVDLLQK